ncbi:hypothetical protein A3K02_01190 [candidate division WS6 bacterium RIFOXYD1_FULL_33_8]|uniref:Phospholipid-binding protein, PBP family n=2 Tax=Candidatus Dojkabacteria TaxID=74243 RepID=A0A0G0CVK3_9BACT|nr:MAG: hypothetical protein UR32_C0002G0025 [candidate division WS6 bacterium GW2011_GWE2_33_157]KKP44180.1 MAG: hypothetical protein UR34_C0005G0003 [candidate division WS6 bacterium GW2011_GWC1_33_20]KKP45763.1 MAG: hypothetical protein UR36_C0004G0024 [candidate division WS6 bacterium GW2011_GWF1_33_233]KKP55075.1 MAG: hypothetical protein UR47_C0005G0004 [candidate division WS6 bacterium GW2011_GWB1_33_6]KKP55206.1 MAG: hypothetical protein UR45_C0003G0024 [candidate division WS6 bacterium
MIIGSTGFENEGYIPSKYTCDGEGEVPTITVLEPPEETKSFVLIVEDPDAPAGLWIHWMVWNIRPSGNITSKSSIESSVVGKNSSGNREWDPICPPNGEHRYFFKIYALDKMIDTDPEKTTIQILEGVIEKHIIGYAELVGRYKREF